MLVSFYCVFFIMFPSAISVPAITSFYLYLMTFETRHDCKQTIIHTTLILTYSSSVTIFVTAAILVVFLTHDTPNVSA